MCEVCQVKIGPTDHHFVNELGSVFCVGCRALLELAADSKMDRWNHPILQ